MDALESVSTGFNTVEKGKTQILRIFWLSRLLDFCIANFMLLCYMAREARLV